MPRQPKVPRLAVRSIQPNGLVETRQVPISRNEKPCDEPVPATLAPVLEELIIEEPPPEQQVQNPDDTSSVSDEWSSIRKDLLSVHFSQPVNMSCVVCCQHVEGDGPDGYIKCDDCGPSTIYCSKECCEKLHKWNLNAFHKPMQWVVSFIVFRFHKSRKYLEY